MSDEEESNWMRFARSAERYSEQNLIVRQDRGQVGLDLCYEKPLFVLQQAQKGFRPPSVIYRELEIFKILGIF